MIVGIMGPGGCGGTFLDWSIHYLSGQDSNCVIACDSPNRSKIASTYTQQIVSNPIVNETSHLHAKTHPNTVSLPLVINHFSGLEHDKIHTFYYVDAMLPTQQCTTYNEIIKTYPTTKFITYQFQDSDIDKIFYLQYEKIPESRIMFNNSILIMDQPLEIWDRRELLSLYYPECIRGQILNEKIEQHNNNFILNFSSMIDTLPITIIEIFNFLKQKIDMSRWDNWSKMYKLWQKNNSKNFFTDLNKIINNIVQGIDSSLEQYNITFAKEVVLLSKLLYNHNMALQSYGIDTLSHTTSQWYKILEKNVYHNTNNP